MGSIYLFAGKFSHIVLNKAVYEKVVEMSTKRRQCRNRPNVFCYICGEYMMAKHRFNVRDFGALSEGNVETVQTYFATFVVNI